MFFVISYPREDAEDGIMYMRAEIPEFSQEGAVEMSHEEKKERGMNTQEEPGWKLISLKPDTSAIIKEGEDKYRLDMKDKSTHRTVVNVETFDTFQGLSWEQIYRIVNHRPPQEERARKWTERQAEERQGTNERVDGDRRRAGDDHRGVLPSGRVDVDR